MFQKKEQDKTPEEQLSEVEIGNTPIKGFRVKIVEMIQDLRQRMGAQMKKIQEMFKKQLEYIKNKQKELNNTKIEMKNTVEVINSRINEAEEWISELEDRIMEITDKEQNKEKRMKRNENRLRNLWDIIKHTKICIIGVPEGEEREKGPEKIFEQIIAENFPNMGKETVTQVQEAERVPYMISPYRINSYRINPRRNMPRHT